MNFQQNYPIPLTLSTMNIKIRRSSLLRLLLAIILFNLYISTVEISNILPHRLMELLNIKPKPPAWVKTYFEWHANQRTELLNNTNSTNDDTKSLIIICHRNRHCGGIADRLKSLPYFLIFAEQTNRMLFIKWEKFDLEDFMQPPEENGFDWRLPNSINVAQDIDHKGSLINLMNDKDNELHDKKHLFLSTHLEHKYELEFPHTQMQVETLHRVILNYFFEPVEKLQTQIEGAMEKLGLIPNYYVSAHYRSDDQLFFTNEALSNTSDIIDEKTEYEINNAIQCAVQKGNDMTIPVYFTSSNARNVKYVLQESPFAENRNPPVKVIGIESERVHSEHPSKNYYEEEGHDPSELYPIFIDLWIMGYSKCVAFGNLGFGRLGARLTGGYCFLNHQQNSCPVFF